MMDNLQQSRDIEIRFSQQQQRSEVLRKTNADKVRRQRRLLLAALACVGAAITVFPRGWQQLADAPLVSWLLALLALALLWPQKS